MTCSYCGKPDGKHYPTCPLRPDSPRPTKQRPVADVIEVEANVPAYFRDGRIEVVFQHDGRSYRVMASPGYVAQQIVKDLRLPEKSA